MIAVEWLGEIIKLTIYCYFEQLLFQIYNIYLIAIASLLFVAYIQVHIWNIVVFRICLEPIFYLIHICKIT